MFRMENGYVGYWVMYQYEKGIGGVLSVGMNGSPVLSDYALIKWTDTSESALKNVKFMGFTSSSNANIGYGVNCALVKPTPLEQLPYLQETLPCQGYKQFLTHEGRYQEPSINLLVNLGG